MKTVSPFRFVIVGSDALRPFEDKGLNTTAPGVSRKSAPLTPDQRSVLGAIQTTQDLIECFKYFRKWTLYTYPRAGAILIKSDGSDTAVDAADHYFTVAGVDPNSYSILDALEDWLGLYPVKEDAIKTFDTLVASGVFDKPEKIYLDKDQNYQHIRALSDYFHVEDITGDTVNDVVALKTPSKISDTYTSDETPAQDIPAT